MQQRHEQRSEPEHTRRAWHRFVETGVLEPGEVRSHVDRAWRRCHAAGASPHTLRARELSPGETARLLDEKRDVIEAARPYMQALSRAAGPDRHAAMLGDERGIVLDVVGDEESVHGPERVPGPGALLSEAVAGANGIGTPLAEDAYVELVGPEHFIEGFHVFTCQGVPLRDGAGETVGVLGISVRRVGAADRIHEILVSAAYGVEAELGRRRLEEDVRRALAAGIAAPEALERLRQDVVQVPAAARLRVDRAARLTARDRKPDAVEVLAAAEALTEAFRRRAEVWAVIASDESGAPGPVDVSARLQDVLDLLETERAVRRLTVDLGAAPGVLRLDDRDLTRQVFRGFLEAFEQAPKGATVTVSAAAGGGRLELRFAAGGRELSSTELSFEEPGEHA